ncbi:MAG: MBL fold metallo-hydrolase [Hydromonas sp.]|nr:MBL fold metallo-hydrolase [Hydromonas sp.]
MVKLDFFRVGSCCHPNWVTIQGGGWRNTTFPSLAVLLRHPVHGNYLFDTGYSEHFHTATKHFPEKIYRLVTPIRFNPHDDIREQLHTLGVDAHSIRGIFISHFHADHVAALIDFPKAAFHALSSAYDGVAHLGKIDALRRAFLPTLLPHDFKNRYQAIDSMRTLCALPKQAHPFAHGYDFFGDGSVFVVELAGHARGQMGLWIQGNDHQPATFLVADACWSSKAFEQNIPPSWLSYFIHDNKKAYLQTLQHIHELSQRNRDVLIMPSHCEQKLTQHTHSIACASDCAQ